MPKPPGNSNRPPTLVIVCGLPATGKSTLATEISQHLNWPLFTKDAFKELLWDNGQAASPTPDRATSKVIGHQAIASLLLVARELCESGISVMIESNFLPQFAMRDIEPFTHIARVRQVHCNLPTSMALSRYTARIGSPNRHAIHADAAAVDDLIAVIESGGEPLPLPAPLLQVDTSDGYDPGLKKILEFCRG